MQSDRVSVVSRCSLAMQCDCLHSVSSSPACVHTVLLCGFCQSLRCRKLGSRNNWSYKPLPVKEQLQRRLYPTKHSPTYCNYRNKPQRNSYDYSNHTVHKGHVWEHLGHPKTLQYPRRPQTHHHTTSVKNKDEPKNRQNGLYEAHYRLGLCIMPNLQY